MNLRTRLGAEVREDGRRRLLADVRAYWFGGALIAFLLIGIVVLMSSPLTALPAIEGTLVGVHQRQHETGRGARYASVEIAHGQITNVVLPDAAPILVGHRVRLRAQQRQWPPKNTIYRFDRYMTSDEQHQAP